MVREPCVYMLIDRPRGRTYVGVTSDLKKRVWEHKNKVHPGYSSEYCIDKLVWFERCDNMQAAIRREKTVKKWCRATKFRAVETMNQEWRDLYEELF